MAGTNDGTDDEAWYYPLPAKLEATCCLRLALANGGIESMREVIAVSATDKIELDKCAEREPALAARIARAIEYRREVLQEFDRLAKSRLRGSSREPQVNLG